MTARLRRLAVLAGAVAAVTAAVALLNSSSAPPRAAAARGSAPAAAVPPGAPTADRIAALQAAVRAGRRDAATLTALGGAYLQRVRETGDPGYYARAEGVVEQALRMAPRDAGALTVAGTLAAARHDFRRALALGTAASRAAPLSTAPDAVVVDALVELGRLRRAAAVLQAMVDRKPTLGAYARVSYLRELRGDLRGAAAAMRLATGAGAGASENAAAVTVLLGDLELRRGHRRAALRSYREALALFPGLPAAQAALARADASGGRLGRAIRRLTAVTRRLPLPEHLIALGEAQLAAGRRPQAARTFALVRVQQRLLAAAKVDTGVDAALFEADHGEGRTAVRLARAAWRAAPSVRSADALAAALTRAGRPQAALRWARRALSTGWREPSVLEHAGQAAAAAGRPAPARGWLRRALAHRDALSPWRAQRARRTLEALR